MRPPASTPSSPQIPPLSTPLPLTPSLPSSPHIPPAQRGGGGRRGRRRADAGVLAYMRPRRRR
uniref:Uncharacterized protein n=1 Tax=Oryza glumipatula TaxID=40148 RepID=A0A0E0B0F8_9ORYZ